MSCGVRWQGYPLSMSSAAHFASISSSGSAMSCWNLSVAVTGNDFLFVLLALCSVTASLQSPPLLVLDFMVFS